MKYDTNKWLTKTWETNTRFYVASLVQNLFGTWEINCHWGSKQNKRGGSMIRFATSHEDAINIINDIDKRRVQRKYQRIA